MGKLQGNGVKKVYYKVCFFFFFAILCYMDVTSYYAMLYGYYLILYYVICYIMLYIKGSLVILHSWHIELKNIEYYDDDGMPKLNNNNNNSKEEEESKAREILNPTEISIKVVSSLFFFCLILYYTICYTILYYTLYSILYTLYYRRY